MLQLTAAARQEILRLRQRQNQPGAFLRLGLQPSSCAQWSYVLSLEAAATEEDNIYDFDGLQMLVTGDRALLIQNLQIDFVEDLTGGVFRFDNPLATESCRCGYAFSIL